MSRYAEAHVSPQGAGDARPTALQIINDEDVRGKLHDKVIVITGTSSGIGVETARALAVTGARLFLTARDLTAAGPALASFFEPERMELIKMDQTSLASVRAAAQQILAKTDKVNVLINNAGVMALPTLELTEDGHEMQFGVNHLSHFLLFELLKPALLAATTPGFHSRVVALSSIGHNLGGINETDNYNFEKGGYHHWTSYAQSKTANIYMANEIERRYGAQGLHATSVHHGGILTNLARHISAEEAKGFFENKELMRTYKSVEQGAATTVLAAVGKQWEGRGGRYLEDCDEAKPAEEGNPMGGGYAKYAYNEALEGRLWRDSLRLVGLE